MTVDEERKQTAIENGAIEDQELDDDEDDETGSPFDHPAFLPVLLWALAIWFGYDGWINQDPDMLEHLTFNRWGFAILSVLGSYFTVQGIRESRRSETDPGR